MKLLGTILLLYISSFTTTYQAMKSNIEEFDQWVAKFMSRWGYLAIRISFAVIFIWFGILKPFGLSAAEPLVLKTVAWLPLLESRSWLIVIGWWEVIIGIMFLFKATTRVAIGLLFLQMVGTFMPLFMLPQITFQNGQIWLPTMEGQYIIKNLMIISGALVVGGSIYKRR